MELCPNCNAAMVLRNGRRGEFYGCTRYSKGCRGTRPFIAPNDNDEQQDLPEPVGSVEQKKIWDFLKHGTANGMIEARAGSGKTYTIVNAIKQLRGKKVAVFSFNNHIIKELNSQLAKNRINWARGLTYNSFGFKSVKQAMPNVELMKDKQDSILVELYDKKSDKAAATIRNATGRLVDLCKCYMEDGYDQVVLTELIDRFNIDLGTECSLEEMERRTRIVMDLTPQVLRRCLENQSVIDFNDQVWFCVKLKLPVEMFDIVLVDEAQDTNFMQQQLLQMACP